MCGSAELPLRVGGGGGGGGGSHVLHRCMDIIYLEV